MADQIVTVWKNELEPGTHICRETISRALFAEIVLPFGECSEVRPDWGVYSPIVTFSAVERALRRRNVLPAYVEKNEGYSFSVADAS